MLNVCSKWQTGVGESGRWALVGNGSSAEQKSGLEDPACRAPVAAGLCGSPPRCGAPRKAPDPFWVKAADLSAQFRIQDPEVPLCWSLDVNLQRETDRVQILMGLFPSFGNIDKNNPTHSGFFSGMPVFPAASRTCCQKPRGTSDSSQPASNSWPSTQPTRAWVPSRNPSLLFIPSLLPSQVRGPPKAQACPPPLPPLVALYCRLVLFQLPSLWFLHT